MRLCSLAAVACLIERIAKVCDGLLIAMFAAKLRKVPPYGVNSGDTHRHSDGQTAHCGQKAVEVSTRRRLGYRRDAETKSQRGRIKRERMNGTPWTAFAGLAVTKASLGYVDFTPWGSRFASTPPISP
jgi:hypothetical protein